MEPPTGTGSVTAAPVVEVSRIATVVTIFDSADPVASMAVIRVRAVRGLATDRDTTITAAGTVRAMAAGTAREVEMVGTATPAAEAVGAMAVAPAAVMAMATATAPADSQVG
ncbi:MAG TPA: hypothetical protein VME70_05800 [Mycobacteriales bacterium]|nr:hypothetical protein [Mycobacteriales bacterium]